MHKLEFFAEARTDLTGPLAGVGRSLFLELCQTADIVIL